MPKMSRARFPQDYSIVIEPEGAVRLRDRYNEIEGILNHGTHGPQTSGRRNALRDERNAILDRLDRGGIGWTRTMGVLSLFGDMAGDVHIPWLQE